MSKERVQQQITPKQLFNEKGLLGLDLAEEFAKARWKVEDGVVELRKGKEVKPFGRNAGAIEVITGDNREFRSYGFSQPSLFQNPKAHTERILMRDVLEELVPGNFPEGGLRRPSQMANIPPNEQISANQRKKLVLNAVTEHASTFKEYLDRTESVVKMFSERIPCGKGSKEGCNKFLDNILPETDGTVVGYFTEKISYEGTSEVEKFSNHMVKAYQKYLDRPDDPEDLLNWRIERAESTAKLDKIISIHPDNEWSATNIDAFNERRYELSKKHRSHHNTASSMDS